MSALAREARLFVRAHASSVLSTLSKRLGGFPFGSICPLVLDHAARPLILISTLAEHTKNLLADDRASLIVHPCAEDAQAAGRVTLVGRVQPVEEKTALRARYLRYLPQAAQYFDMHDFHFFRLEIEAIRYIGGFGKIHWVDAARFAAPENELAQAEEDILAHMNHDHAQNLRDYCRHGHGVTPERVEMIGVDIDGFDLRADGRLLRFDFPEIACTAMDVRRALVQLAQETRL